MGFFSRESKEVCYFCGNDYFEMLKTIDNNFVCKDCLGNEGISESKIMMMSLNEVIKSKAMLSIGDGVSVTYDTYCSTCNKRIESGSKDLLRLNSKDYCKRCGHERVKSIDKKIGVFAGTEISGYEIEQHLDFVCVEALVNLGYNINQESQSLIGRELSDKELKFNEAKDLAMVKLKVAALDFGGDAVIGVNISSSVFYTKRSVVAAGTVVKTKKMFTDKMD